MSYFGDLYKNKIQTEMVNKFGYTSVMQTPKIEKIIINMGVGDGARDSKKVAAALLDVQAIAGQKPVITKAKKSIASFKLREGMEIGVKVTLRKERMYEFLERLINVALPRVRDFRGVPGRSFDGRGNYALGLKEQIVFNEINYDKIDQIRGMNIVIVTTANTNEEAKELLKGFGMPFVN